VPQKTKKQEKNNMARLNVLNLSGLPWMKNKRSTKAPGEEHLRPSRSCAGLSWLHAVEDQFYEDGVRLPDASANWCPRSPPRSSCAGRGGPREDELRHAPLLLVREWRVWPRIASWSPRRLFRVISVLTSSLSCGALLERGQAAAFRAGEKGLAAAFTSLTSTRWEVQRASPVSCVTCSFSATPSRWTPRRQSVERLVAVNWLRGPVGVALSAA